MLARAVIECERTSPRSMAWISLATDVTPAEAEAGAVVPDVLLRATTVDDDEGLVVAECMGVEAECRRVAADPEPRESRTRPAAAPADASSRAHAVTDKASDRRELPARVSPEIRILEGRAPTEPRESSDMRTQIRNTGRRWLAKRPDASREEDYPGRRR